MKRLNLITFVALMAAVSTAYAQRGTLVFPPPPPTNPPTPPPVYIVNPPPRWPVPTNPPEKTYVYHQRPLANPPALVTSDQAQAVIDRFKAAYAKMGSPRFLIYVNRNLVNDQSAMKLQRRTERIERSRTANGTNHSSTVKSVENNVYRANNPAAQKLTLADKQTVRDVERLFGRPLREAGASLADQRVATELLGDRPLDNLVGSGDTPEARKDREAIRKIADAVIEVLISSKTVTVPTISGSQTITIPDIEATAIRLKDSKILGQASSSDVTSRVPPASLGNFSVSDFTDATALALMDDMTSGQPQ